MEWQLPDGIDRMAVNAALTTLTEHWDPKAGGLVTYAFHRLPTTRESMGKASVAYCERTLHVDSDGVGVETAEDVCLHYGGTDPKRQIRIGGFMVFRTVYSYRDFSGIVFQDSRADEREGIESEEEFPRWVIVYHRPTCEPLVFYRLSYEPAPPSLRQRLLVWWVSLRTGRRFSYTSWKQRPERLWIRNL